MIKKPIDRYEDLSKHDIEKKMDEFGEMKFTRKEERAMIRAALETFLPPALLMCALFALSAYIVLKIIT